MVARVPELSGLGQRALVNEILQVPGRGGARSLGDADVIIGAQSTPEAVDSFGEHAGDGLVLALV